MSSSLATRTKNSSGYFAHCCFLLCAGGTHGLFYLIHGRQRSAREAPPDREFKSRHSDQKSNDFGQYLVEIVTFSLYSVSFRICVPESYQNRDLTKRHTITQAAALCHYLNWPLDVLVFTRIPRDTAIFRGYLRGTEKALLNFCAAACRVSSWTCK